MRNSHTVYKQFLNVVIQGHSSSQTQLTHFLNSTYMIHKIKNDNNNDETVNKYMTFSEIYADK